MGGSYPAFGKVWPRFIKLFYSALLVAGFWMEGSVVLAQDRVLTTASPEEAGMSAAVLSEGVALYQEAVNQGDIVGAVLLVARDGKVVMHEAIGWRDKAVRRPMQKDTMFRMASNTKPVVATAIAMLKEQGQFAYTDMVRQYITSFDNYRAGFMQIHHLLTHTSGFRIPTLFLPPEEGDATATRTLLSEVARFGEVGAQVLPGTSYSYSNPGYNTLGALIELRGGKPLEQFLRDELYRPLGMVDSYHLETADKLDGKLKRMSAVYYEKENNKWVPGWVPGGPPQVPFVRASGGMISTAWDYAIFLQMYLNGGVYGGQQILSPETVATITTPYVCTDTGSDVHQQPCDQAYGYGWFVAPDGVFSHGGSDGTNAWVDPARNVLGIVLTQTPGGKNPITAFRQMVNLSILPDDRPGQEEKHK